MRYRWNPYVPVSERLRRAAKELAPRSKESPSLSPVVIRGRTIAATVWGKAWCDNLERYSDFSNRLPRGRTYARNGSVVDLQIAPGRVIARVAGSRLYQTELHVEVLAAKRWKALAAQCAGAIDSVVELLAGRFAAGVMERLCDRESGMFPAPRELRFACSCPDWAVMCKHIAAVMYGVGARLDHSPELLFVLRNVDPSELIAQAGAELAKAEPKQRSTRRLESDDLGELFGLDLAPPAEPVRQPRAPRRSSAQPPNTSPARKAKSKSKSASSKPKRSRSAPTKGVMRKPKRAPRASSGDELRAS